MLRRERRQVTEFDEELETLAAACSPASAPAQGVGLAANQSGVDLKVSVYDCRDDKGARHIGIGLQPQARRTVCNTRPAI